MEINLPETDEEIDEFIRAVAAGEIECPPAPNAKLLVRVCCQLDTIKFLYAENARIEKESAENGKVALRAGKLLREAWAVMRDSFYRMETIRKTHPEIALASDMLKLLGHLPHLRVVEYTHDDVLMADLDSEKDCLMCKSRMVPARGQGGSIYLMCPTQEKHVEIIDFLPVSATNSQHIHE